MLKMIKTDMQKIFLNSRIYICMVVLGAVYSLAYLEMTKGQNYFMDFTNGFTVLSGNAIMVFCFLICIVGGSFLYCSEEKYGYFKYEIQRVGIRIYTLSKVVCSVFSGFMTAVVGIGINIGMMIFYAFIVYEDVSKIWPNIEKLERFVWEIIVFSMLCGLLSAIGFLVTTFCTDIYIGITSPIIIYYILVCLTNWIPIPLVLQISKVYLHVGYVEDGHELLFCYALLYTACWMVLIYKIARKMIQRRLERA